MSLGLGVSHKSFHDLFGQGSSIHILESSDLFSKCVSLDLDEFLAKEHIDLSLLALFKGNVISISVLEDVLVGSPVLNSGILGSSSEKSLLPELVLVVEGEE